MTPSDNKSAFNGSQAAISSSTATSLVTTVPPGTSGHISVTTPNGKAVSSDDFFIPPSPYTASDVEYTGRMAVGESKTASVTNANKIGMMLFEGMAGHRLSINLANTTIGYASVYAYKPDGMRLVDIGSLGTSVSVTQKFVEPFVLPSSGTFMLLVDPDATYSGGNMPISIYEVPPDVTGNISIGGSTTVTTTTPGQNASLTFTGTAGQEISLRSTNSTMSASILIKKPDGTNLGETTTEGFIDKTTLPVSGIYTIFVDPLYAGTGSTNITLYDATDLSGTITPGGSAVTTTTTIPGQNSKLTFSGISGQRVSLQLTSSGIAYWVYIKKPDGSNIAQRFINSGFSGDFIDPVTLDTTGTYTISVDPFSTYTGSVTLTLYDVPADVTGTLTVGGAAATITTTMPGQNASLTFDGTSGQQVTVHLTNSTINGLVVKLLKDDGTTLTTLESYGSSFNLATQTLPATSTYTIMIDPIGVSTGSTTVNVTNP
jgi:hypothetical protein